MVADCIYLPGLGQHRAPSRSCFAVPVIGFVLGLSVQPNSLNAAFERHQYRGAADHHERLPKVIDYAAAAFIVVAMVFAPVAWLMTG